MKSFKILILGLLVVFSAGCKTNNTNDFSTKDKNQVAIVNRKALFDGKNLDAWYIVVSDKKFTGKMDEYFVIEKGMIHVYPKQEHNSTQSFAGLFTKESYSNYKLTLEYKWGTKKFKPRENFVRDAGVIFHQFGPDVIWPYGVECQIQEGDTGDIWAIGSKVTSKISRVIRNYDPNGELITRGTPKEKFQRFHRSYDWENPSGWNKLVIEVKGNNAKYTLNGYLVNEVIDAQKYNELLGAYEPLTSGKIVIQAEGAELYYRNIFIEALDR